MEQRMVMLIVDDFDINRAVLKSIFKWDYDIIEAGNGYEALEIVEREKVDIIMLDIVMPEMDGIELLAILKGNKKLKHVPVIVNTQMGEHKNEIRCLELGADDFIVKPYNPQIIKKRVANLLNKSDSNKKIEDEDEKNSMLQLAEMIDDANIGIIKMKYDNKWEVIYFNEGICKLLGYSRDEVTNIFERKGLPFSNKEEEFRFFDIVNQESKNINLKMQLVCSNGERIWTSMNGVFETVDGEQRCYIIIRDYTNEKKERDRLNAILEELKTRAERDWLTGIYNRESFCQKLEEMLENNPDKEYVLQLWDIDRFKVVNELFGSNVGDRVLIEFAHKLENEMGQSGLYGRLEADRIAICVPLGVMEMKREDIMMLLHNGFSIPEINYPLQLHLGIYNISDRSLNANQMCDRARIALQSIRGNYMKRLTYYDEKLKEIILNEQELVNEMEKAISKNQFYVEYQPIFSAKTKELVSAEALVRWRHPEKGIISPSDFIPFFERNGFITKLDLYVWDNVCRFIAENKKNGIQNVPISVNVSRINLYNTKLCDTIMGILDRHGVEPEYLKLEITESAYMENPQQLKLAMETFHSKNFKILMDDFGSGYSSLNMLKDVPTDILKIDMKFIDNIDTSERACKILYNILQMAHSINMEIVAEGVENENQFELLKQMGCDNIQGYYFSKPLSEKEFSDHILMRSKISEKREEVAQKKTILVVDDVEMNRVVLVENLKNDYHIIQAKNGKQAIDILLTDSVSVDLVITDIIMPVMNGYELIKAIRKNEYIKATPIVVISAFGEKEHEIEALKIGAIDVIAKPFEPEILKRRVENIIKLAINENIQAELHSLRKTVTMRRRFMDMFKSHTVGIAQVLLNRKDKLKTMHTVYANNEFMKIHQLNQTDITAIMQSKIFFNYIDKADVGRVYNLLVKAITWNERVLQIVYNVTLENGQKHTILSNIQMKYTQDEVYVEIAEIDIFNKALFGKVEDMEHFVKNLLQDTNIKFWRYDMERRHIVLWEKENINNRDVKVFSEENFIDAPMFVESDRSRVRKMHERLRNGESSIQEVFWCRRLDRKGEPTDSFWWNRIIYQVITNENGRPVLAIGLSEDITSQMHTRVKKQNHKKGGVKEYLYAEIDITNNRFVLLEYDDTISMEDEIKEGFDEFFTRNIIDKVNEDDKERVAKVLKAEYLRSEYEAGSREISVEFQAATEETEKYEWYSAKFTFMFNEVNGRTYSICRINNISSEKKKRYHIEKMIEQDGLTEVFNRAAFVKRVDEMLSRKSSSGMLTAFYMIDIDNFKTINDTFGHEFGDTVLRAVAEQLTHVFRKEDYIGRIGGDEFAVFVGQAASKEIVCNRAEQICDSVRVSFKKEDKVIQTSCSVGIAFGPEDGNDFQSLYRMADQALYEAKRKGKDTYCTTCNE